MAPAARPPARNQALDGLRGLAALAVITAHVVVATSVVQSSQFFSGALPLTGADWLFAKTPLVLPWSGREWVIVFFMLSGFVLSLSTAEGARFDPARYYPTRIVRLYLPVWACLVFAAAVHEAFDRGRVEGATEWLNLHASGWTASATFNDVSLLVSPGDYYFTTVLWTLRWEVAFSLLLPLFLLCATRIPLRLLVVAAFATIVVGGAHSSLFVYMPAFMLGTALAFASAQVKAVLAERRAYVPVLVASPILLTATHWMPAGWRGPALGMVVLGATGLVAAALAEGPFARALRTRPMQLVGRRSFSLYLVHEPLLVATAFALGGRPSTLGLALVAAGPIALATIVFYRVVERPSHDLARRLGRASARRGERVARAARPSGSET